MSILNNEQLKELERMESMMVEDPKGFRQALGLSRQQFKQMSREKSKNEKAISKLTPVQICAIDKLMNANRKQINAEFIEKTKSFEACINAVLSNDYDMSAEEQYKFWEKVNKLVPDDLEARKKLFELGEEESMKIQKEVKEYISNLLLQGKSSKEIKEAVKFKFPLLSTAQIQNAYKECTSLKMEPKGKIEVKKEDKEVEKQENILISQQIIGELEILDIARETPLREIKELEELINSKTKELSEIESKKIKLEDALEILRSIGM